MPYFWFLMNLSAQADSPPLEKYNIQYIRAQEPKEQLIAWQRLKDPTKEERLERAKAIFFIQDSAELAIELLRSEDDPEVYSALLFGIGKNGQASHLPILLTPLQQRDVLLSTPESIAALRALSMMADRGKLTTNRIELTAMLLQQRQVIDPVQRRLVATILAQLEIPALPPALETELFKAMYNETDGEAASLLLKTIAQLRRPTLSLERLHDFCQKHSAWEVRAAYAQWYAWRDPQIAHTLAQDDNQHVRIQIQKSLAMAGQFPEWRRESLAKDASVSSYQALTRGEESPFEETRAFLLAWSGPTPEPFLDLLQPAFPTQIRIAVVQSIHDQQALTDLSENADELELRQAAAVRRAEISTTASERKRLLKSGDDDIIAGTASVLAKDPKGNSERDLWDALDPEAPTWVNLSIMHALLSIHKQGKSRSSKEYVSKALAPFKDHESPAILSLYALLREAHELSFTRNEFEYPDITSPLPCGLRLFTSAGEIRISFHTDLSPYSIAHIQEELQAKSIEALSQFSQFTPQHTIQFGQNPPQNYILDEHNIEPFERGSVGLALRTPNSGGSQIFVSFRERPEFIGEYTHIGEVSYGLNTLMAYPYSHLQSLELEYCTTDS